MAILSDIILYPIKSCAGIRLQEAVLTSSGLMSEHVFDREWMVVDAQGRFLTQREHPRMALIVPRIKATTLELRAPGMLRLEIELGLPHPQLAPMLDVQVWDDTLRAYDCDEVTAAWFSQAIGVPCRLARFHPDVVRATSTTPTATAPATSSGRVKAISSTSMPISTNSTAFKISSISSQNMST